MINDVRDKVKQFLEDALEVNKTGEYVRVTGIAKTDDGWTAKAEAVERSRMLPEYRIFEKKYYLVKLNSAMEIYAYKPVEKNEDHEEESEST
jgi:Gas vesicle synthesis protein GvpO.